MKKKNLNSPIKEKSQAFMEDIQKKEGVRALRGGVLYEVLKTGESDLRVQPRSVVTCHYKGMLPNGRVFDKTEPGGAPAAFRVNELISGFQIALVSMHPGDIWRVYIPSDMGYGDRGAGSIPGGSALIFEIELISVM